MAAAFFFVSGDICGDFRKVKLGFMDLHYFCISGMFLCGCETPVFCGMRRIIQQSIFLMFKGQILNSDVCHLCTPTLLPILFPDH